MVALGKIAHDSALRALGQKLSAYSFVHRARHARPLPYALFDGYHCSRYNTNTGKLTAQMFASVFAAVRNYLDDSECRQEDLHRPPRRVTL